MKSMHYELWDMDSGNLLDDFDSQGEATEAVRALTRLNGASAMTAVALVRVDDGGRASTIASGAELQGMADDPPPTQEARPN